VRASSPVLNAGRTIGKLAATEESSCSHAEVIRYRSLIEDSKIANKGLDAFDFPPC
jgi:hypothetical protein